MKCRTVYAISDRLVYKSPPRNAMPSCLLLFRIADLTCGLFLLDRLRILVYSPTLSPPPLYVSRTTDALFTRLDVTPKTKLCLII